MSYPTSAGKLSEALKDTPQFEELSVAFFDSCQHPNKLENPCCILRIGYSYRRVNLSSDNKSIEQGWYDPKWKIIVYPVPRTSVSAVKKLLDEHGFEQMRQWLLSYKSATGKDGNCWLHLLYDLDENNLKFEVKDELIG
ncbi:hypothetical protein [[Leptolyngbya] sp. PCC 7376]|uniref:hypothetical protein n=1 Tax=[Leptolyngbya] sp. PCC 7376 TaxID=111781 RepID=UPI001C1DFC4A|nr:hypothetical protein [[Leptolyngbya] sp. PCC 7376]